MRLSYGHKILIRFGRRLGRIALGGTQEPSLKF